MSDDPLSPGALDLRGKRSPMVGIANDQSIAYGCVRALPQLGAEKRICAPTPRA